MKGRVREDYLDKLQEALENLQVIKTRLQQRGDLDAAQNDLNRWKKATEAILDQCGVAGQRKTFRGHVDFDVLGLTGGHVIRGIEKYEEFLKEVMKTMPTSGLGAPLGPFDEGSERLEDIDQPRAIPQKPEEERSKSLGWVSNPKRVFVVHGRNEAARIAMFQFLRALGLEPIEWSEAVGLEGTGTPYIGRILDRAFEAAQAVIVLFTGDDLARLGTRYVSPSDPPEERTLTPQPRANVLFEAGLAFGRQPERTILVTLGQSRPFTDIAGLHVVRMDSSPERRQELASRLRNAGCLTDHSARVDWLREGDFDSAIKLPDIGSPEAGTVGEKTSPSPTTQSAFLAPPPLSELEAKAILSMLQSEYHEIIAMGLQRIADSAFRHAFERDAASLNTVEQLTTVDNPSLRGLAFRALGSILRAAPEDGQGALWERLIPRVVEGMKAGVRDVRQAAIQTAAAIPDDRIIEVLEGLLNVMSDDEAPEGQVPPVAYALKAFHEKKPQILARLMERSAREIDGKGSPHINYYFLPHRI